MQLKSSKCGLQRTPRISSMQWKEWMLVSLSLVYWFFYYLRSDSQQTTNKARYDAICVQECPNFNIWGYGFRSKRFEGSKQRSDGARGSAEKNLGLPGSGLRPPLFATLLPTVLTLFLFFRWLKKREKVWKLYWE